MSESSVASDPSRHPNLSSDLEALDGRLLFAIPKKGRLHEKCLQILSGADIQFRRPQRLDVCLVMNHPIALVFLPAADIPSFVGNGNVDLGITGHDVILEAGMQDKVVEVQRLGFGKCALQVQVPEHGPIKTVEQLAGKRVVTSFEVVAGEYFKKVDDQQQLTGDQRTKIQYIGGSVEAACALGLAEGIVDLVESGETMRAAGLHAISTVLETEAVLIKSISPSRADFASLINLVASRIAGVVAAEKYVVCSYNISREALPIAVQITPGRRAPTISPLEQEGWVDVSAMVMKKDCAKVMDELVRIGAQDVLIFNLDNCRAGAFRVLKLYVTSPGSTTAVPLAYPGDQRKEMEAYTPVRFKALLGKLVKTPEFFTPDDLKLALNHLFTPNAVLPEQIGAFLAVMHMRKLERCPKNLVAAAEVLHERALKAAVEDGDKDFVVDIVGTGGDGHNTFNVSTTAGIVAAGAGARVVKHGNRASTSSSGSADLLQSLDCLFVPPTPATVVPISRVPFTFILAPHYHPSLATVDPYRKALPFRTLFNILGPLINPARPRGMVVGVAEPGLGLPFAQSLRDGGVERALVVCGAENLDEISCAGHTLAWELKDGEISERKLHPEQFGLSVHPLTTVAGGTPTENADTLKTLLRSGENIPESLTPVLHFVLLNASALLVVAGLALDYREGVRLAMESITSGKAWKALEAFRDSGKLAMSKINSQR
ncbi:hypothetical protein ID866_2832 [Astraeus odoratus]|nr:hypothetical protein ID866_2832 [Astraeus odoratus]